MFVFFTCDLYNIFGYPFLKGLLTVDWTGYWDDCALVETNEGWSAWFGVAFQCLQSDCSQKMLLNPNTLAFTSFLPASWCFFKVLLQGPPTIRDHLRRFIINTYRNTHSMHTNKTKYSRASRFNVKLPIDGRLPWVILKRNCALARLS